MRKTLTMAAIAAALTVIPVTTALATTPPDNANVEATSDDGGFDDWGLIGLLGLAGLAGLAGRNRHDDVRTNDVRTNADHSARR